MCLQQIEVEIENSTVSGGLVDRISKVPCKWCVCVCVCGGEWQPPSVARK